MALDDCVRRILCGLSSGAQQALALSLDAIVVQNNIAIAALQAQAAALQIKILPVQAARDAAQSVIQAAQETSRMLPLALIADCTDLGQLNLSVLRAVDRELAALLQIVDDLTRLLSIQNELAALIDQLNVLNDLIAQVKGVLAECQV